ncbi:MAG: ABC transporter substrate-binding protein [Oscillospiraceae bacterium]|jgi:branched-chain amino acid transport system substrate-binding protein|nr:ABC transporter substrate-binding protein [Oscillospiraceae bacterium]
MKKRVFALAMAAVMTVGLLSGCGDKKAQESKAPENGGSTAANAIKVGGCGPLTGGAAIYGNAAARGAQIAADEINAKGGLQIDLRYEDDAHDAEKSVNAYNTLKGWGMQVFLGSVTSTPGVATSVEANNDHMFYLTPSASSTDVLGGVANPLTGTVDIQRKDNVFQMCFVDPNQGSASAQYIYDQNLGSSIAVIYKNDDVYSTGVYNSFDAKAKELGLNVVSVTTFTTDTQTDFSVQLGDAKNAGADLVFLPMYYDAAALIFTQANAMGYAPKWFGIDGMDGILGVQGFDTTLAEGVMLLTPFNADAEDEATKNFVKTYQDKYSEVPNQFAADAYDCVYAIYNALTEAGVTADMSASDICDKLMAQFTAMTFDGLTGEGMTWDASGAVTKSPKGMVIQDGAYVGMD